MKLIPDKLVDKFRDNLKMLDLSSTSKIAQAIRWKYVGLATALLLFFHFFFFSDLSIDFRSFGASPTTTTISTEVPGTSKAGGSTSANQTELCIATPDLEGCEGSNATNAAVPNDEYVAVCMSVKDQALDLVEYFIHHYHHMGIRRFYIMDDGSSPPLSSYEYPGVPRSVLSFTWNDPATRSSNMQMVFYKWCIERYSGNHTWIAFLDGDEFLETPGNETLNEVLESFEADETVGALGINWRLHTSNGLLTRPESARKSFTTCIYDDPRHQGAGSDNRHIKTIIKTSKAGHPNNPHKFTTTAGSVTVGEDGDEVASDAWRTPITRKRIGLHHYAVKSLAEYEEKKHRGNGMTDPKGDGFWNWIENEIPHVNCTEMAAYDP